MRLANRGEGQQVVVVHPDHVVGPQPRCERFGQHAVDAQIAGVVVAREFGEAEPVVHARPQHAVGEAEIIFLAIGVGQVDLLVADAAAHHRVRGAVRLLHDRAAPAEPDAAALAQRVAQRHRQAAGGVLLATAR
jgi:hypothetical protein